MKNSKKRTMLREAGWSFVHPAQSANGKGHWFHTAHKGDFTLMTAWAKFKTDIARGPNGSPVAA